MKRLLLLMFLVAGLLPAMAQESASFKLKEFVFNGGGHPVGGVVLSSPNFHVTLDSFGEGLAATAVSGPSFHMDAGLVAAYPPPGEIRDVLFSGQTDFCWSPEKSVGNYNVYRDTISTLPGGFGTCSQPALTGNCATDASAPPFGEAWFYMATAENLVGEEGTKGFRSSGVERTNLAPCP